MIGLSCQVGSWLVSTFTAQIINYVGQHLPQFFRFLIAEIEGQAPVVKFESNYLMHQFFVGRKIGSLGNIGVFVFVSFFVLIRIFVKRVATAIATAISAATVAIKIKNTAVSISVCHTFPLLS